MAKKIRSNPKIDKKEELAMMRHSGAHIMAAAVQKLYPKVKLGIGPAIEDGFYYDFEFPEGIKLTENDLSKIEKEMLKIVKKDEKFVQSIKSIKDAKEFLKNEQQPYTIEILERLEEQGEKEVSFYQNGDFINMCTGPHVESTGKIRAFKLHSVAGAYWKGDENEKMLTRIYAYAFPSQKELDEYVKNVELAKESSHMKIGKEMELYAVYDEIGQGLPVWLPDGYAMRVVLEDYLRNLDHEHDYVHILTPHIHKRDIFETSGHLQFYKDGMYAPMKIEDKEYYLKPMNCPAGMIVYKSKPRSYRDLPIKMGEFGTVYRYEQSGELHGLQRVRGFTQNDAHVFCTPEQLEDTFLEVYEMLMEFYNAIGFKKYKFKLGLSDMSKDKFKFCGTPEGWKKAEDELRSFVKKAGVEYVEEVGDAAFYGPKLDVQAVNVYGKEDSISTIQIDFNLPERFGVRFIDKDGKEKEPFVIHRALIGSYERFFAFLIEYYAGKFPLWFAPRQVRILPISEKVNDYAHKIDDELKAAGKEYNLWIRSEVDDRDGTLQSKIRAAEEMKIPYVLVVGEREKKAGAVSVRVRGQGDKGAVPVKEFSDRLIREVRDKKLELWC